MTGENIELVLITQIPMKEFSLKKGNKGINPEFRAKRGNQPLLMIVYRIDNTDKGG